MEARELGVRREAKRHAAFVHGCNSHVVQKHGRTQSAFRAQSEGGVAATLCHRTCIFDLFVELTA